MPRAVRGAGLGLTNGHAEGYPGCRYGGCEFVDVAEPAIERSQVFGGDYVNVRPTRGRLGECSASAAMANVGRI